MMKNCKQCGLPMASEVLIDRVDTMLKDTLCPVCINKEMEFGKVYIKIGDYYKLITLEMEEEQ